MSNAHNAKVRQHFDRWAHNYDGGRISRWLRAFQQRTIEAISPPSNFHVLDVGCGTGWATVRLGWILSEGRASGIDLSPVMVAKAQAKSKAEDMGNVEFTVADAENIPYEDGLFDAIMCTCSFHHYLHPVRVLSEFLRVLRPGGRAYVLDAFRDRSVLVTLFDLGHKLLVGDHVRYYHTRELKGFFHAAGFRDVREEFRVRRFFIHGKFLTSIVLVSGRKQ